MKLKRTNHSYFVLWNRPERKTENEKLVRGIWFSGVENNCYLNYDEVARKFAHSRSRMLKAEVESDSSRACNAMLRGQTNETMGAAESIITRRTRERIVV